jgi:hypothetical protein
MTARSSTETLIKAMEILSNEIQSDDGVANSAILEASERLKELHEMIKGAFPVVRSANYASNMRFGPSKEKEISDDLFYKFLMELNQ